VVNADLGRQNDSEIRHPSDRIRGSPPHDMTWH